MTILKTQPIKSFFLDRHKEFIEVEVVKETAHKRLVKVLEGKRKGKTIAIHPDGVANSKLYPRLFHSTEKPTDFFNFKGRLLMKREGKKNVPDEDKLYRFQPWLTHVIDNINAGENSLLTGGMGVGKTSQIVALAAKCGQSLTRINFNGETRLSDLIGKMQVIEGATVWQDGVLPTAMKEGHWLLLDELDSAEPAILSLLNPVLEEHPILVLKENGGEVVKPHPDFRIFATANSIGAMQDKQGLYAGTNTMNGAFLDRWCVLHIPPMPFKEELRIVKTKVRGIKNRWAKRIVEFANKIRDVSGQSGIEFNDNTFSTRLVLAWAKRSALLNSPIEGAKIAFLDKIAKSEHEVVLRALDTHFGNTERKKRIVTKNDTDAALGIKKKRGRPKKEKPVV